MSLVEAAGTLDQRPVPNEGLRRRIVSMRAAGQPWKALAAELDALRDVANIGSGSAATALSSMLGRPVDISVPTATALPFADAVERAGDPEEQLFAILLPIVGDLEALVLLLFSEDDAERLCGVYGIEPATPDGESMLGKVGNVVGTNFINVRPCCWVRPIYKPAPTDEHLVMLSFRVPRSLRRRLKLAAASSGRPVQALAVEAIETVCQQHGT